MEEMERIRCSALLYLDCAGCGRKWVVQIKWPREGRGRLIPAATPAGRGHQTSSADGVLKTTLNTRCTHVEESELHVLLLEITRGYFKAQADQ